MFVISGTVTQAVAQTGTVSPLMKVRTHLEFRTGSTVESGD